MAFEFEQVEFYLTRPIHNETNMTVAILQLATQLYMVVDIGVVVEVFDVVESFEHF